MPKGIRLAAEDIVRRKREIFEVAARLFLKKGFAETSMREIAEAARVGKSTLYDYFPEKDDILLFALEQEMAKRNRAAAELAELDTDAVTKLGKLVELHYEFLACNQTVTLLLAESLRLKPRNLKRLIDRREEYRHILQSVVECGMQEGHFRQVDVPFALEALIGLMTLAFFEGFQGDPPEMARRAVDIFVNGICANHPSTSRTQHQHQLEPIDRITARGPEESTNEQSCKRP